MASTTPRPDDAHRSPASRRAPSALPQVALRDLAAAEGHRVAKSWIVCPDPVVTFRQRREHGREDRLPAYSPLEDLSVDASGIVTDSADLDLRPAQLGFRVD